MQASLFLAKLIGPILLVVGLSLLINPPAFRALAGEVIKSRALIFLFGLLDLTAGLAIVLTHNVWIAGWPILITLLGWLVLIRGIVRVAWPDRVMALGARMLARRHMITVSAGITVALGLMLSFFGYAA